MEATHVHAASESQSDVPSASASRTQTPAHTGVPETNRNRASSSASTANGAINAREAHVPSTSRTHVPAHTGVPETNRNRASSSASTANGAVNAREAHVPSTSRTHVPAHTGVPETNSNRASSSASTANGAVNGAVSTNNGGGGGGGGSVEIELQKFGATPNASPSDVSDSDTTESDDEEDSLGSRKKRSSSCSSTESSTSVYAAFDYESSKKSRLLTDTIVRHPYLVLLFIVSLTGIFGGVWFSGALNDSFAEDGGQWMAIDEPVVRRYFSTLVHEGREKDNAVVTPLTESLAAYRFQLLYSPEEDGSNNVFTTERVRSIFRNEQAFLGLDTRCDSCTVEIDDFTKFCQVNVGALEDVEANSTTSTTTCAISSVTQCVPPISPLSLFFPGVNYYDITQDDVNALTQQQIDDVLASFDGDTLASAAGPAVFFDKGFRGNDADSPNPVTKFTRSLFSFGAPLCPQNGVSFDNQFDDTETQRASHAEFITQYTDFFAESNPPGLEVRYLQEVLATEEFLFYANGDLVFAGLAAVLIMVGITLQTNSLFIGVTGMLQILSAYPWTLFFYHAVLRIEFDTSLNRLAIFIILGIGADDIFIFTDAWKQSYHEGATVTGSLERRLNWVWQRSAQAMLVTSATTFVAFLMTTISPMPMIEAFGFFSALMVLFNYLLVITLFPTLVVLWNKRLEHQCCFKKRDVRDMASEKVSVSAPVPSPENSEGGSSKVAGFAPHKHALRRGASSNLHSKSTRSMLEEVDVSQHRWLERFFYNTFSVFLQRFKVPIIVLFAVIMILGSVGTSFLTPPTFETQAAPDESELKFATSDLEMFPASAGASAANSPVDVFYGVNPSDPINRDGLDGNDQANFGTMNLDPNFIANFDRAAQEYLVSICDRVIEATSPSTGELLVARGTHDCPIREFLVWNDEFHPNDNAASTLDARLWEFVNSEAGAAANADELFAFDFASGEARLQYLIVRFLSTMSTSGTVLEEATRLEREWDELVRQVNAASPTGLDNAFPTARNWAVVRTSDVMVTATIQSILISFAISVVCLTAASQNVIVAGFASVSIVGIVVTTIGVLTTAGKPLDITHAVIYVMLVGLSVDYVAHLANAFNQSRASNRVLRARAALLEVGISVFGGAATTIVASVCLLPASIPFFVDFGRTLLSTIVVALFWAIVAFMALLMQFGPNEYPTGDVTYMYLKYVRRVPDAENRVMLAFRKEKDALQALEDHHQKV